MKVFSFKNIRILFLLSLLALVAIYTKEQRLNSLAWYQTLPVIIFPINGDASAETDRYIQSLSAKDFQDIDTFFNRSAKQFQLITQSPISTSLGHTVQSHPPKPPTDRNNTIKVMLWSMKLRYWTYMNTPDNISNKNRIRLYVLYHQGNEEEALEHSLGLQKGLVGIIHAYADPKQNRRNVIVMAHEILHTVGATDKYDYSNNQPIYPQGYAKPNKSPLFPQRYAEIMAGRVPLSQNEAEMPKDLRFSLIGEQTAKEINWIQTQ